MQLVLYPFALNPTSEVATQAAWCAGEQGKFWEFHHMLYRRQELWNHLAAPLERLSDFAKDLNLDTTALKSCVESGRMQDRIKADKAYGQQLQVNSTPTLFINDQPYRRHRNQRANSCASSARSWTVSSVQASSVPVLLRRWWHLCTLPWVAVLLRVLARGRVCLCWL